MSSLCFGISVTPDMKYVHKPAVNTHFVCMSHGVYEFCPLHDINPWLLRPCTPPYPTPPAPAPMVPSPSMMRPIWRCTTSASPLCPSWLTASWSSTSAWRFFWTMLPSTGKSGYLSVPFACLRTLPSFSVIYVIWLMFFFHLALLWPPPEKLQRMPCYGGDPSSTGLYLESSTACSFSLVFEVCSVTQHCRITARFDCIHIQ